jgi:hypothetical protein
LYFVGFKESSMVSANDYPGKSGFIATRDTTSEKPKKRRFRLFASLAAPFKDVDERAMHKKLGRTEVRNKSKGNMFPGRTVTSSRRSPRGEN